jgi:hypothetical protein
MMDFPTLLGYFSGLYLIKPDMEALPLVRTALVIHILDACVCRLIAANSNRNKNLWTLAGLVLGIWAVGALFFLPARREKT